MLAKRLFNSMNKFDQLFLGVWVVIAILVAILSLRLGVGTFSGPGPGLFPFVFAIFLGTTSTIYWITSHFKQTRASNAQIPPETIYWKRPSVVVLFLIIYSLCLTRIGYLISTFILLFILFNIGLGTKRKWKMAIIGAVATAVTSYLIFNKLLQIPLPKGILGI